MRQVFVKLCLKKKSTKIILDYTFLKGMTLTGMRFSKEYDNTFQINI